jgi:hypothetical protein
VPRDGGTCDDGIVWTLVDVPIDGLRRLGPDAVVRDRTARFVVVHELQACDEPAVVLRDVDPPASEVVLRARVWRPLGIACPPVSEPIERVVIQHFRDVANWTVRGDDPGGPSVQIRSREPTRDCTPRPFNCQRDCDCPDQERCLDGFGLDGAFTACARSCEVDRECLGTGSCESPDDGLELACQVGFECAPSIPCPDGFDCVAAGPSCVATFDLSGDNRPCACDADCTPGLSCVAEDDGGSLCKRRVPTPDGDAWCTGFPWGHYDEGSACFFIGE